MICRDGGIGRHAGFRSLFPLIRSGSSTLPRGTKRGFPAITYYAFLIFVCCLERRSKRLLVLEREIRYSTLVKNRQLAALLIWWCEGTKPRKDKRWKNSIIYAIELTNTDPRIIKIFLTFIVDDLGVDIKKIKGQIQLHEGDNVSNFEKFWSTYLNLPACQFNRTIVRKKGTRLRDNHGTFKLRVYGKELFYKLQGLLDQEMVKLSVNGV